MFVFPVEAPGQVFPYAVLCCNVAHSVLENEMNMMSDVNTEHLHRTACALRLRSTRYLKPIIRNVYLTIASHPHHPSNSEAFECE